LDQWNCWKPWDTILVEKNVLSIYQAIEDLLMPDSIFSMLTSVELPVRDDVILPFSVREQGSK
jgi:hypothetical protein